MRQFKKNEMWLTHANLEMRLIYSLFCIFALIGHLSFITIAMIQVGPGVEAIIRHYRGDPSSEIAFPKEFMELLETTHFHAYIEGIVLLVLAHLFVATLWSRRVKIGIVIVAFVSTFVDLAAPWLIRYVSGYFAYAQILAWIAMTATYFPLTCAPLYYLWHDRVR